MRPTSHNGIPGILLTLVIGGIASHSHFCWQIIPTLIMADASPAVTRPWDEGGTETAGDATQDSIIGPCTGLEIFDHMHRLAIKQVSFSVAAGTGTFYYVLYDAAYKEPLGILIQFPDGKLNFVDTSTTQLLFHADNTQDFKQPSRVSVLAGGLLSGYKRVPDNSTALRTIGIIDGEDTITNGLGHYKLHIACNEKRGVELAYQVWTTCGARVSIATISADAASQRVVIECKSTLIGVIKACLISHVLRVFALYFEEDLRSLCRNDGSPSAINSDLWHLSDSTRAYLSLDRDGTDDELPTLELLEGIAKLCVKNVVYKTPVKQQYYSGREEDNGNLYIIDTFGSWAYERAYFRSGRNGRPIFDLEPVMEGDNTLSIYSYGDMVGTIEKGPIFVDEAGNRVMTAARVPGDPDSSKDFQLLDYSNQSKILVDISVNKVENEDDDICIKFAPDCKSGAWRALALAFVVRNLVNVYEPRPIVVREAMGLEDMLRKINVNDNS